MILTQEQKNALVDAWNKQQAGWTRIVADNLNLPTLQDAEQEAQLRYPEDNALDSAMRAGFLAGAGWLQSCITHEGVE